MKILAVMEFTAAGTPSTHRAALRRLGVDYRIAAKTAYMKSEIDWCLDVQYMDGMAEFAAQADIIQFHPAIGQPWSYQDLTPRFGPEDCEALPFGTIRSWPDVPRIYYFHGSRNAAHNVRAYRDNYSQRGHIWASTVDYVENMNAYYAPPCFDYFDMPRAALRDDDSPLIIAHAPTDPGNCHTEEFLHASNQCGVLHRIAHQWPHDKVLAMKATCNAGFDHLRGCFSVNTLENCAMGLLPLVGMTASGRAIVEDYGGIACPESFQHLYPHANAAELAEVIRHYARNPLATRQCQAQAHAWVNKVFAPLTVASKMKAQYEKVLSCV